MFEWGGGSLWCGNDAARDRFGVGPIEDRLPLSDEVRRRLDELSAWHDTSLNRDDPPSPGPWTVDDHARFHAAANALRSLIGAELGPEFDVVHEPL